MRWQINEMSKEDECSYIMYRHAVYAKVNIIGCGKELMNVMTSAYGCLFFLCLISFSFLNFQSVIKLP